MKGFCATEPARLYDAGRSLAILGMITACGFAAHCSSNPGGTLTAFLVSTQQCAGSQVCRYGQWPHETHMLRCAAEIGQLGWELTCREPAIVPQDIVCGQAAVEEAQLLQALLHPAKVPCLIGGHVGKVIEECLHIS